MVRAAYYRLVDKQQSGEPSFAPRQAKSMASPRAEVECPCGHTLSRWRNRAPNLVCDGGHCDGHGISIRAWRWSCSLCDYDVCETCASVLALKREGLCKPISTENELPAAAAADEPEEAPEEPPPRPKPPLVAETSTPDAGKLAAVSPAVGTGRDTSWLYMPQQSLDSIRKDLQFRPSESKVHKPSSLRLPSGAAVAESLGLRDGICLPVHEADAHCASLAALPEFQPDDATPALLPADAVPDLSALGLPAIEQARLEARREQLRRLFELEVAREVRAAPSAFESACCVCEIAPADGSGIKVRVGRCRCCCRCCLFAAANVAAACCFPLLLDASLGLLDLAASHESAPSPRLR